MEESSRNQYYAQFVSNLSTNETVQKYLVDRGFDESFINSGSFGFCSSYSKYMFPLLRGRLIVPIHDCNGNLIALAGRQIKAFEDITVQAFWDSFGNEPAKAQDRVSKWRKGKWINEPRLTAWYGDPDKSYKYSGKIMVPKPWSPILLDLKEKIEHRVKNLGLNIEFNSVLINKYRNGLDSQGWHSDDEKELGLDPVIASLSLGAERTFQARLKEEHAKKISLSLIHGSLLVMSGRTQSLSQHRVPKIKPNEALLTPCRINLTFRTIR